MLFQLNLVYPNRPTGIRAPFPVGVGGLHACRGTPYPYGEGLPPTLQEETKGLANPN